MVHIIRRKSVTMTQQFEPITFNGRIYEADRKRNMYIHHIDNDTAYVLVRFDTVVGPRMYTKFKEVAYAATFSKNNVYEIEVIVKFFDSKVHRLECDEGGPYLVFDLGLFLYIYHPDTHETINEIMQTEKIDSKDNKIVWSGK